MNEQKRAWLILVMNTFAFTVCFAVWVMNGVLITYLVSNGVFHFDRSEIGWLIGLPVLTGSISRLPLGILTDKYGGRIVNTILMLTAALATLSMAYASTYYEFLLGSLGFGLAGGSFAVGTAYTSICFKKEMQGTVLGIFGVGDAGAALTSVAAPLMLRYFTSGGTHLEGWRELPKAYAAMLLLTTILYYFLTFSKKQEESKKKTLAERLAPLKNMRVHRFSFYYFFVFGGFVALSQWLIPYYVNVYSFSIASAGAMAATFSFPSGIVRALGGVLSDRYDIHKVMYWVFGLSLFSCALLIFPQMDIYTPGEGVQALSEGKVVSVSSNSIFIRNLQKIDQYTFSPEDEAMIYGESEANILLLPNINFWQFPVVKEGDQVSANDLLAKGVTHIYFQANVWVFTTLVFILGIMMGIGKAAVFKHIPEEFPNDVGVVGGIVGVIGGLGGFICPIIFAFFVEFTGVWISCWVFFAVIVFCCLELYKGLAHSR